VWSDVRVQLRFVTLPIVKRFWQHPFTVCPQILQALVLVSGTGSRSSTFCVPTFRFLSSQRLQLRRNHVHPLFHHQHLNISEVSALSTDPYSSEDNTYPKPCIELFTSEHGKITLAAFTLPASAFPCHSCLFPRFVCGGVSNSLILRVSSEE
jgi:hypothetical protein